MKRPIKITLRIFLLILVLVVIVGTLFLINFIQATKTMTPGETGKINDTVWCIRDKFVNAYIFMGDSGYVMVDAGFSKKNFKVQMEKIGISPEEIKTLLLTHTDGDHIGATGLFKNAKIYMHREEEQMINGTTSKMSIFKTVWKYGPYNLLSYDRIFVVNGLRIKIIHTPGHTPGSACYIIGNDYLATGDNLSITNGNYSHFIEKFNMNTPEQTESLKLLPPIHSFKYIVTSHNGPVKVENNP